MPSHWAISYAGRFVHPTAALEDGMQWKYCEPEECRMSSFYGFGPIIGHAKNCQAKILDECLTAIHKVVLVNDGNDFCLN